jgi:hypothetical protein
VCLVGLRAPQTVRANAIVFSTGAINNYGGSGDLTHDIAEANDFSIYSEQAEDPLLARASRATKRGNTPDLYYGVGMFRMR